MTRPFTLRLLGLAIPLLMLSACGGGSSGGGSSSDAQFSLLVSDAPVDELSAFELTLTGVYLRAPSGQESANLLAAPRTVDLRNLVTQSALVQVARAGLGPWESVRVELDPASVLARGLDGTPVPVTVVAGDALGLLPTLIQPSAGGRETLDLDIDLEASLDDSSGSLVFDPTLRPRRRTGEDRGLDEIHGRVTDVDAAARALQVLLLDRDSQQSFGEIRVELGSSPVLFDDDDGLFADESAFFAAAASARIEAHGGIDSRGVFVANRVEIEDDSSRTPFHVKGVITELDLGASTLRMRITRIDKGRSTVIDVLRGLGDPSEIVLDFSSSTIVLENSSSDSRRGSPADLAVGQEIKAKFATFSTPFRPARVEIEHGREFEGRIVGTSGLPGEVIVHLEHHDPAVRSGRVDSSRTDVRVRLGALRRSYLDLSHEPSLPIEQLLPGLRVKVRGPISGPSSAPIIDADVLRVRPGELEGVVVAIDRAARTFTIDVDEVDDEFGGGPLGGTVVARLADGVRFDGDAGGADRFFDLFDSGATLEVEVEGIARDLDFIDAHEVDVDRR